MLVGFCAIVVVVMMLGALLDVWAVAVGDVASAMAMAGFSQSMKTNSDTASVIDGASFRAFGITL